MRSRRRGSVLAGAMAVIFMLMVIAMSMHYYQSMTRQSAMAAEGDLRFREGRRYVLAQQLGTGITPPSGLVITGNVTNDTPGDAAVLADLYAKNIFDRDNGLPDLRALGSAPLHAILRLKPFTTDFALMVFGKRTYIDVLSMVPGWAAYAPKGNVTIGDLRGWSNPSYGDPRKSTEAYSGVPAKVYGRKDVNVDFATYGELYTVDGTAKIKNGPGVAYKTKEPVLREYADAFFTQATAARDALVSAAASGDKTASLVSESVGPSSILDLFFGGSSGLEQFLSLRNANHFWMPMIPGFSPYPPYVYEFYFSVPFPPDNASYDVNMAETVSQEIADLQKLLPPAQEAEKKAGEALKKAQNDYNANQTDANLDALKAAQTDYNKKLADLNNIQAQIDSKTAQLNTMVQNGMGSGMQSVPPTRAQDPDGTEGITGWNYSVAGKLLGSLIGFLAFDAKKIADSVSNDDVKLVHFGGKDRLFGFVLDEGHMVLDGTVTVPRGRSLSLRSAGTITVRGDLWLQRGSTLYADCPRLTLETPPGNVGSSSFWTPCGRVFLEEGASLVCTGDVDVPGSLKWGSVVVGGIPGKIHPITTAIIGRNVKLTNGVFSGSALDDLLAEAGKLVPSLASVNNKLLRGSRALLGAQAVLCQVRLHVPGHLPPYAVLRRAGAAHSHSHPPAPQEHDGAHRSRARLCLLGVAEHERGRELPHPLRLVDLRRGRCAHGSADRREGRGDLDHRSAVDGRQLDQSGDRGEEPHRLGGEDPGHLRGHRGDQEDRGQGGPGRHSLWRPRRHRHRSALERHRFAGPEGRGRFHLRQGSRGQPHRLGEECGQEHPRQAAVAAQRRRPGRLHARVQRRDGLRRQHHGGRRERLRPLPGREQHRHHLGALRGHAAVAQRQHHLREPHVLPVLQPRVALPAQGHLRELDRPGRRAQVRQ
ncbi:MAG: hypothetical protein EB084_18360 [Proteobacteria bacterium]|nr:hypothetical protein [Pseudomonadota bacterium]